MPFPIFVADGRAPGETIISPKTSTVFEINPLEFGSHDSTVYAFSPTKYLGSSLSNGLPTDPTTCTNGFDNAAFMMGTSSSLFNNFLLNLNSSGISSTTLQDLLRTVLELLSENELDIADFSPSPFYNYGASSSTRTQDLTLVDGGSDLQNIPLQPLLQPFRAIDVIFANDNSADTLSPTTGDPQNWPNGTALRATYERSLPGGISSGIPFPAIPDDNTFVNLGLNTRPTWFGCDGRNFSADAGVPPLLVYIPNTPWTVWSNTSTLKMAYSYEERDGLVGNGWEVGTQGGDEGWGVCVRCAVLWREMERREGGVTEQCRGCGERYCWDGRVDVERRGSGYEPELRGRL